MEIWKDIKDYEGLYQVSNYGRVKSLGGKSNHKKSIVLKQNKDKNGYFFVILKHNGTSKYYKVHRLVAEAFIPNPNNKPQVNHLDENKQNNNVYNLEWASCKENIRYSQSKKVNQYSKDGQFIKTWDCITEAAEKLNIQITNITACCRGYGKHKTTGGYIWKYKD